jgi:hypothetical protein
MFVLDRARLAPYVDDEDHFDNRWTARLPAADQLKAAGVSRVLYVTPEAAPPVESDDVVDDLVAWARLGLDVRAVRVADYFDAATAEADFLVQGFRGVLHAAVLIRNGDEGGADELGFGRVAIEAIALAHERQARVGRLRLAVTGDEGRRDESAQAELKGLIDRAAVFGVLNGHLEGDLLSRREEIAILWGREAHLRRRIANDDR